jgi:tripartite motif-containing protein 71
VLLQPLRTARTHRIVWVLLFGLFATCTEQAPALGSFGTYGDRAGGLTEPFGIEADDTNGDVYILDTNNHRIERYTRDGAFALMWGWGVSDGRTRALQRCVRRCFAGAPGTGAGQLAFAQGIAIDEDRHSSSYRDIYVVDIGNHRVEKFTPTGRFLLTFGGEVNRTAHKHGRHADEDRCPVAPGDRCGPGARGSTTGQFEFPVEGAFIAVGLGGSVYVGDRNKVKEFSSQGIFQRQIQLLPALRGATGEEGGVSGLAVDASGNLYVIRNGVSGVREYGPNGQPIRTFDDKGEVSGPEGPTPALSLAPGGYIFIDEFVAGSHRIAEYDVAGREVANFDGGHEDALHGLAYSPVAAKLYALNTNGNTTPPIARVRVLTPPTPSIFLARLTAALRWAW